MDKTGGEANRKGNDGKGIDQKMKKPNESGWYLYDGKKVLIDWVTTRKMQIVKSEDPNIEGMPIDKLNGEWEKRKLNYGTKNK